MFFVSVEGSDGFVIGYFEDVGYGMVVMVECNGVCFYFVMSGFVSLKECEDEVCNILEWGLSVFEK